MKNNLPKGCLIQDGAFLSMTLSVSEVYKKEAIGFLLGYRTEELFIVEHAIPFQTAERGFVWSKIPERRLERIQELSSRFGLGLRLIGDFHSHSMIGKSKGKPAPSPTDVAFMEKGNLYIIVAINELKEVKKKTWRKRGKKLMGSLGNFDFAIGAYYCDEENHYVELDIRCPFAQAL